MVTANSANTAWSLILAAAGPVEPAWLHTAGQIAGTLLLIELLIALLIFAAMMFGLAYAAWWLHRNVVPVIGQYSEQAQQYIAIAERGSERVAEGVATFHGARVGIVAGFKAFFRPASRPRPAPPPPAPPPPAPPPPAPQP
jgi:hypothetical protein